MSDSTTSSHKGGFQQTALDMLRLGLLLLAVYWCYKILAPFIPLLLWGAILAVALYPTHRKLVGWLGNRVKLSAILLTLVGLIVLTAPVILLTESLVVSSMDLAESIDKGAVHVPPPPERVQDWPVVGEGLYSNWKLANENLSEALTRFGPHLATFKDALISTAGGAGVAFLAMFVSVIIAGVFLAAADRSVSELRSVLEGLVGERALRLLEMSTTTVRSVARGVVGVAIIEAILAGIGMVVAGVPAAGFWAFLLLVLSIAQLPPMFVLIPMVVYVLAASSPLGAVVFITCAILAVLVDTFLKPVLLGRTADAPTLVILLGAIGGMILWGIVGLFVGAVLLVLSWEALEFWVVGRDAKTPPQEPVKATES